MAEKDKIIQIAANDQKLFALTASGKIFIYMNRAWREIILPPETS